MIIGENKMGGPNDKMLEKAKQKTVQISAGEINEHKKVQKRVPDANNNAGHGAGQAGINAVKDKVLDEVKKESAKEDYVNQVTENTVELLREGLRVDSKEVISNLIKNTQKWDNVPKVEDKLKKKGPESIQCFEKALEIYETRQKTERKVDAGEVRDMKEALSETGKMQLGDYLIKLENEKKTGGASDSFDRVIVSLNNYLTHKDNIVNSDSVLENVNKYLVSHSSHRFFQKGRDRVKLMQDLRARLIRQQDAAVYEKTTAFLKKNNRKAAPTEPADMVSIRKLLGLMDESFKKSYSSRSFANIMNLLSRYRTYMCAGTDNTSPEMKTYGKEIREELLASVNEFETRHKKDPSAIMKDRMAIMSGIRDVVSTGMESLKDKINAPIETLTEKYEKDYREWMKEGSDYTGGAEKFVKDVNDNKDVHHEMVMLIKLGRYNALHNLIDQHFNDKIDPSDEGMEDSKLQQLMSDNKRKPISIKEKAERIRLQRMALGFKLIAIRDYARAIEREKQQVPEDYLKKSAGRLKVKTLSKEDREKLINEYAAYKVSMMPEGLNYMTAINVVNNFTAAEMDIIFASGSELSEQVRKISGSADNYDKLAEHTELPLRIKRKLQKEMRAELIRVEKDMPSIQKNK